MTAATVPDTTTSTTEAPPETTVPPTTVPLTVPTTRTTSPRVVAAPAPAGVLGPNDCSVLPERVVSIESGCRNIPNAEGSGCDGYYQICRGTWDNFMGYPTASSAPKWVQDEKARQLRNEPGGLCRHWAASGGCSYAA